MNDAEKQYSRIEAGVKELRAEVVRREAMLSEVFYE